MIVLSMTNCPPRLRGDLSKWLLEINTGVYVGNASARVREALWKRVCENILDGQATMVFTANNEQRMEFYVHNTSWKPVDLDGIRLMKHPNGSAAEDSNGQGFCNAAKWQALSRKRRRTKSIESYVIIDIETTGLSSENDEILELGALEIENGECVGEYQQLIAIDGALPADISSLTGIKPENLKENAIPLRLALPEYFSFLEGKKILGYNTEFDFDFLEESSLKANIEYPEFETGDIMYLARSRIKGLDNYKLETVAKALGIDEKQEHRALADCKLMYRVYCKLNEK